MVAIWEAWCLHVHILLTFWGGPDRTGGPWEQQDGHEVPRNRIFSDLGVILGPVYISFLVSKPVSVVFVRACFLQLCLSISEPKFRRLGLQIQGIRKESTANIDFSQKSCFVISSVDLCRVSVALGAVVLFFAL